MNRVADLVPQPAWAHQPYGWLEQRSRSRRNPDFLRFAQIVPLSHRRRPICPNSASLIVATVQRHGPRDLSPTKTHVAISSFVKHPFNMGRKPIYA